MTDIICHWQGFSEQALGSGRWHERFFKMSRPSQSEIPKHFHVFVV